jgi:hypothetical protein
VERRRPDRWHAVAAVAASAELRVRRRALLVLVLAKLVGSAGLAWDIQWHVRVGRDSFWIAPHVLIYASVVIAAATTLLVLARDTARARRGFPIGGTDLFGVRGTPGFHLAACGVVLVLVAAPIDDFWHRVFGLDVTLWSPPHLLALLGSAVNSVATVVIALEVYPGGGRRLMALFATAALLHGSLAVLLDPAFLVAFRHGRVLFHAWAMLATLVLPVALLPAARLSNHRFAPVVVVALAVAIGLAADGIAHAGFALLEPVPLVVEPSTADASEIATVNIITAKNGGPRPPWAGLVGLAASIAMSVVDVRRRPLLATLAWAVTLFGASASYLATRPAFQPLVPGTRDTLVALAITLAAAPVGCGVAARLAALMSRAPSRSPVACPSVVAHLARASRSRPTGRAHDQDHRSAPSRCVRIARRLTTNR